MISQVNVDITDCSDLMNPLRSLDFTSIQLKSNVSILTRAPILWAARLKIGPTILKQLEKA